MTFLSAVLFFGAGYIVGLSLCSGLLLGAIRQALSGSEGTRWKYIWGGVALGNVLTVIFGFSFVLVRVIDFAEPEAARFWSRFACFTVGFMVSGALSAAGFAALERLEATNKIRSGSKDS